MGETNFMGLKIDNHLSIGHIITTLSLAVTCVFAYANMKNDISNLQQSDKRIELRQDVQETRMAEQQQRSDMQYEKIQVKIDKIYEVVVQRK